MTIRPLLYAALGLLASTAWSDDQVAGAELLRESSGLHAALPLLVRCPIDSLEIALLIEHAGPFALWLRRHRAEVGLADAADPDAKLARLRGLAVWQELGVSCDDFMAVQLKLSYALDVTRDGAPTVLAHLRAQEEALQALLAHPKVDERPALQEELRASLALLEQLCAATEDYPEANIQAVEARRAELKTAVQTVQGVIE